MKILRLVMILLTLSACGQGGKKEVRLALAVPLTGDLAALGQGLKRGALLAVEEANTAKRFQDFELRLVEFDDRADPKEAVNVANRIVSDPRIAAVIGHFNSGCSIPASAIYAGSGLPMITPAASNPELTRQQLSDKWGRPKSVFRVNTTDDVQGLVGADFALNELKAKRVAIIHDKTAYGQGIAEEFRKRFESQGGQTLSFDGIQVGDKDFKALLTRIKAMSPGLVYFGGIFNEGGLIVRQSRELGLKAELLLSEANLDPEFLRIAGSAAEGAYVTFLGLPADLMPSAKAFVDKYKIRYPNDELKAYDHYAYEAAGILIQGLATVGADREKLAEYLRTVKYQGVLGETSFDEKGDTLNRSISLFSVREGKFVLAKAMSAE